MFKPYEVKTLKGKENSKIVSPSGFNPVPGHGRTHKQIIQILKYFLLYLAAFSCRVVYNYSVFSMYVTFEFIIFV